MVTKMWEFEHEISYNSAYTTQIWPKILHQTRLFRVAPFNSLTGIQKNNPCCHGNKKFRNFHTKLAIIWFI